MMEIEVRRAKLVDTCEKSCRGRSKFKSSFIVLETLFNAWRAPHSLIHTKFVSNLEITSQKIYYLYLLLEFYLNSQKLRLYLFSLLYLLLYILPALTSFLAA